MRDDDTTHGLPRRFIPVGQTVVRYGRTFVCVERRDEPWMRPADACNGCWFARTHRDTRVMNCSALQCSRWDRKDEKNVWFKEVKDD